MRNFEYFNKLIVGSFFGLFLLLGASLTASAQNSSKEYRDWQQAQARAEREHQDYLRTRSNRDFNQWQDAQRRAEQQYREYQQASNRNGYYNGNRGSGYRYRVYNNGTYYSTDSRGAELLRQAVRNGYAQGYREGQAAKRNGRRYDYYGNSIYSSGSYGYRSYVARNQYQYYFQQGFQRGYEDGFYSRNQYGSRAGNGFTILGDVLNNILNLSQD